MQTKRRTSLTALRRQLILTIFFVAGLDSISKSLALAHLGAKPVRVIGSFLTLHLRYNSGAAFSIAANRTSLLSAFSLAVATLIMVRSARMTRRSWLYSAGLIVGGISGNLLDRIFRPPGALSGQVVDWIEIAHWPTFNLADSSIVVGAILAAVLVLRNIPPELPRPRNGNGESESESNRGGTYKGDTDE